MARNATPTTFKLSGTLKQADAAKTRRGGKPTLPSKHSVLKDNTLTVTIPARDEVKESPKTFGYAYFDGKTGHQVAGHDLMVQAQVYGRTEDTPFVPKQPVEMPAVDIDPDVEPQKGKAQVTVGFVSMKFEGGITATVRAYWKPGKK